MNYYLGGYYWISLCKHNGADLYTASDCINNSMMGYWAYPWGQDEDALKSAYHDINVESNELKRLRQWVDEKLEQQHLGWISIFYDVNTAKSYEATFLAHIPDKVLLALYFPDGEASDFLEEFSPRDTDMGGIGLYEQLSRKIKEEPLANEQTLGFDLIGIEMGGDFHSFHCHSIAGDLFEKFGLHLNSYGLIDHIPDPDALSRYLNDEETGLEPVPWFIVKVKLVK